MLREKVTHEQKKLYLNLKWPQYYNFKSIQSFIDCFANSFPQLYDIDVSCIQSTYLGWKMLPFILDYNSIYLDANWVKHLKEKYIPVLQSISQDEENLPITFINGDIKESHFIINNNQLEIIDNEKASIGRVGYDIAKTLSLYHKKGHNWKKLVSLVPDSFIPRNLLISRIIYNYIYESLVESIIKNYTADATEEIEVLYTLL